jgi:ubiquinone/menaquinone biosynthesis C-methylase UbiE
MQPDIIDFYSMYNEKDRLVFRHSLERLRSQNIISRYINSNNLHILDVGGATGIYSFWLSSLGHKVDLIDLVPKHIDQVKEIEKSNNFYLNSATIGNACCLPYGDSVFDVVLLMGPLYHLQDKEKRLLALTEARRVLKPSGILFVAAISKYASLLDGYFNNLVKDPVFRKILEKDLLEGKHNNPTDNIQYFTSAFFHDPKELEKEMAEAGIMVDKILPVEGFGGLIPEVETKMENQEYKEILLKHIHFTESDESLLGMSFHYLGIGKK